jgi:hypothetical protein
VRERPLEALWADWTVSAQLIASASDVDIRRETGMKSSVLGYGGALLLVAVALAILVDMVVGGPKGGGSRQPVAGATPQRPTAGLYAVSPSDRPASPGRRAVPARPAPQNTAGDGTVRCPAKSASYRRFGDTVRVTVNFPGSGYVAAFVEATGQEPLTKSATNTGRPQTFEFTGVPKSLTQRIGVTVITGAGLRTCDVPAKN